MLRNNQYYPKTTLDSISAQNQPYPSPNYYPYPQPSNTYGLNPATLKSLKTLDINDLQDVFGKGIQEQNSLIVGDKLEKERMFQEDEEISEIKNSIQRAKLNKILAKQMYQNQMRRIENIINDTRTDEQVLKDRNIEESKKNDEEEKKRKERLKNKYLLQQQMKEKELLKEQSKKEYEKDKKDIENLINNIKKEDQLAKEELNRKKNIARSYMENTYARKAEQKRKEKEDEMLEKEKERKYLEDMKKREDEFKGKKEKIQLEKDKIFNQLCEQEAQRQAEKDYWENVRNELYLEQGNKKRKMEEKAEKEKKERQKEEMMASALLHKKVKEENKLKELEQEKEFRKKYLKQIQEEEELDRLNLKKRKQKELELKMEVEKQWQQKLAQYQLQKEDELKNREKLKVQEKARKYIIEQEKQRLIKENEDLLKGYYPLGYQKALNSLKKDANDNNNLNTINNDTKHDIIYNNIFGNSNPNRPSAYLNFGKIKNYVYDKNIQDVNHNINITNYPMYNATANNNYDSYPTPEEYLKLMKQTGQKNYSYAGNTDTTGIPMRSQMPVYVNKALSRSISPGNGFIQNNNFSNIGNRRNLIKSNSTILTGKEMPQLNKYRIQKVTDVGIDKNANMEEKVPEPQ
jgi:hypothetical protein